MSRNFLIYLIVIVTLGMAYVGYQYYLESQEGIDIEINREDVSIDGQ